MSSQHVQFILSPRKQMRGGTSSWSHIMNSHNLSSSRIWMDLLPPFKTTKKCKQYEVTIIDYPACNCMDLFSIMFVSVDEWGLWVRCKHMYYIFQYVMFCVIKEWFIHYPSWSWNEVHKLLSRAKVSNLK